MDSILRALFLYFFLMFAIRITGNRTLNEMTTFDFVLILIMGDASQQAIVGNDYSIVNAVLIIFTLLITDILLTLVKYKSNFLEKIIDGSPAILINNGDLNKKIMDKTKVDESDILEASRKLQGLERLDQIKYAILEKNGEITIIPK